MTWRWRFVRFGCIYQWLYSPNIADHSKLSFVPAFLALSQVFKYSDTTIPADHLEINPTAIMLIRNKSVSPLVQGWKVGYRTCRERLTARQASRQYSNGSLERSSRSGESSDVYQRYAQKLEAKVREKGFKNVEELKAKTFRPKIVRSSIAEDTTSSSSQRPANTKAADTSTQNPSANSRIGSANNDKTPLKVSQTGGPAQSVKPVKRLADIMDMSKIEDKDADAIGALWTAYNASKGNLSAVIPKDVYQKLFVRARQYPMFVLPLSRMDTGTSQEAVEMHLLQWSFFEQKQAHVIFTSLGEYKLRSEFAQPHLTLSHYTELIDSKGIVLMKGEFDQEKGILKSHQAQWLAFALQQFYVTGGARKLELLKAFHERPSDFDYRALIDESGRFTTTNPTSSVETRNPAAGAAPGSRNFSTLRQRLVSPPSKVFMQSRRSYVSSSDQQGLRNRAFVGPFTLRAGGLFVVTALGLYFYFQNEKAKVEKKRLEAKQSLSAGRAKIGGPFNLTDQHGRPFTDKDLLGRFSLVYFGFTRCPDICPLEIDKMGQVVDDLDKEFGRETVLPVFVTCDPARDGVDDVKQYVDGKSPLTSGSKA